jgi:hypothetical protein
MRSPVHLACASALVVGLAVAPCACTALIGAEAPIELAPEVDAGQDSLPVAYEASVRDASPAAHDAADAADAPEATAESCEGGPACSAPSEPPADPHAPPPAGMQSLVYAISKLYVGDTDRSGAMTSTAWESLGSNLDGLCDTASSMPACIPAAGAPPSVHANGCSGIDNSWGETLVPVLQQLGPSLSGQASFALEAGDAETLLVVVDGVGGTNDANASGVTGAILGGAPLGHPPVYDGTDIWPIDSRTFGTSPTTPFTGGWLAGATVVSGVVGGPGEITLYVTLGGAALGIPIRNPRVVMTLSNGDASAMTGTIAGEIPTVEMVLAFEAVAGDISSSLCGGAVMESIMDQILGASDILIDGSQDSSQSCDAISVGIGFDAERVQLGPVEVVAPPPHPCGTMENDSGGGGTATDAGTGADVHPPPPPDGGSGPDGDSGRNDG